MTNSRSGVPVISVLTIKTILVEKEKKLYIRGTFVSMEYVSIEFNSRRISVIVHSDKQAVDSLVLLVCGLSLIPLKREKGCLANCFQS